MLDQDVSRHLALVGIVLVGIVAYGLWRVVNITPPETPTPPALPDDGLATAARHDSPSSADSPAAVPVAEDEIPGLPGSDSDVPSMPESDSSDETEVLTETEPVDPGLGGRTETEHPDIDDSVLTDTAMTPPPPTPAPPTVDSELAMSDHSALREDLATVEYGRDPTISFANGRTVTYVIQPGDTLSSIARHHLGSSSRWSEIQQANPVVLANPDKLVVGTSISIPNSTASPESARRSSLTDGNTHIHVVQAGESPLQIAAKYFLSTSPEHLQLIRYEDGTPLEAGESLLPGTRLLVSRSEDTTPVSTVDSYTVRPGDTLSDISRRVYGNSAHWRTIFNANRDIVASPSQLKIGMVLTIPSSPEN